jgi:hypothetical protein
MSEPMLARSRGNVMEGTMPDDNQDRLRAAIAKRQTTEQARDAAAQQRALDEQRQRERLQQLQAQGQQLAILINNQAIDQSQALRSAGGGRITSSFRPMIPASLASQRGGSVSSLTTTSREDRSDNRSCASASKGRAR